MKTVMSCLLKGLSIHVFPDHIEMQGAAPNLTVDDAERITAILHWAIANILEHTGAVSMATTRLLDPAAARAPRGRALPPAGASSDGRRGSSRVRGLR